MLLPHVVLLSILVLYAIADISTRYSTHRCKALKTKCDAQPYRTVFSESDCYFVIDAEADANGSNNKCSMAMNGAKLAKTAPESVFASLLAKKGDFMLDGDSSNKKKALCLYGSNVAADFPCVAAKLPPSTSKCSRRIDICNRFEEPNMKFFYTIMLPYIAEFTNKERIEVGQTITVIGTFTVSVSKNQISDQFTIHLMTNKDFKNIPLSISVDFAKNEVAFAYKENNKWLGKEAKSSSPFKRGGPFDIRIRVSNEYFQIFVDKKEFYKFNHSLPFNTITHLWVEGNGRINYVKLGENYEPNLRESESVSAFFKSKQGNCGNSFVHGSNCSNALRISGSVSDDFFQRPGAGTIVIVNLLRNTNDFPLQIEFRFWSGCAHASTHGGALCQHNTHTVLTWYKNGVWVGSDFQMWPPIPINKGEKEQFELEIKSGASGYEIYVNGLNYKSWNYRTPSDITGIEIGGIADLDMEVIRSEKPELTYQLMLPYISEFTEKIELGQTITIIGTFIVSVSIPQITDQFIINLMTNKDFKTIPLGISIDFAKNEVNFAYKENNKWIGQETKSPSPFKKGGLFNITIRVQNDHYQIFVDRKEFFKFKHTLPFDTITHLWVEGNGLINYVNFGEKYKSVLRESASLISNSKQGTCGKTFVQGSNCSSSLRISGSVSDDYFTRGGYGTIVIVNLLRNTNDFPLQIEFRFWSGCAHASTHGAALCQHNTHTVLTWYKNGVWVGNDFQMWPPIPIKKGERFEVEIKSGAKGYEIFVNGVAYKSWAYRTPADISGIQIGGIADLEMQIE